jgi:hypothetical protein
VGFSRREDTFGHHINGWRKITTISQKKRMCSKQNELQYRYWGRGRISQLLSQWHQARHTLMEISHEENQIKIGTRS